MSSTSMDERRMVVAELTMEELAICRLVSRGYPIKEIASQLGMSAVYAQSLLKNLREFLGVVNNVGAIMYLIQAGALPVPEVAEIRAEIDLS